ncbi:class I SAM-dependent methyltransferase [Specibacter cremeus]|uniref:class I SAM-dependent methyltransferase n=1 Tax=Specibacter cremeus TaxID=1629051 RepID=UPI000F78BA8B|nr:class I SAM-dependent methyltransferase [Specibacter cremeus]
MSTPRDIAGHGIKACCAAGYGSDAVALLLGTSYHPGGLPLTRRLARALALNPGSAILDVASGTGRTALVLAAEYDCTVHGLDLGTAQIEQARRAAAEAGLDATVTFQQADAEHLPIPDGSFDAVVCECAFCTFPDKNQAAAEFARVLKPGGWLGLTDITVTDEGLPEELTTLTAWIACIADARSIDGYQAILSTAGLGVERVEDHGDALTRMIDQIEARLGLLAMTAPADLEAAGADPTRIRHYTRLVREAATAGIIGYTLMTARKPISPTRPRHDAQVTEP